MVKQIEEKIITQGVNAFPEEDDEMQLELPEPERLKELGYNNLGEYMKDLEGDLQDEQELLNVFFGEEKDSPNADEGADIMMKDDDFLKDDEEKQTVIKNETEEDLEEGEGEEGYYMEEGDEDKDSDKVKVLANKKKGRIF